MFIPANETAVAPSITAASAVPATRSIQLSHADARGVRKLCCASYAHHIADWRRKQRERLRWAYDKKLGVASPSLGARQEAVGVDDKFLGDAFVELGVPRGASSRK